MAVAAAYKWKQVEREEPDLDMEPLMEGASGSDLEPMEQDTVAGLHPKVFRGLVLAVAGSLVGLLVFFAARPAPPARGREAGSPEGASQLWQTRTLHANSTCNEVLFQGLCYRTCTDMGGMEPRQLVAHNCGGQYDHENIQSCTADGSFIKGTGKAPGIEGRPWGACFGDNSGSAQQPKKAPNMCTTDCESSAPTASAEGDDSKYCCADQKSKPQISKTGKQLTCSCPNGLMKSAVLQTALQDPCNTGCSRAPTNGAYLMFQGNAYCCRDLQKPGVKTLPGKGGQHSVECTCG